MPSPTHCQYQGLGFAGLASITEASCVNPRTHKKRKHTSICLGFKSLFSEALTTLKT